MDGMKSALIDLAALECLDAFPRDLDRLLVVIQISPWRREALQRTFPSAEIVEVWPPGGGPWHEDVDRALAGLRQVDVNYLGVRLLDCLTELWRGELERLFALRHVWGMGELAVIPSSPWYAMATRLATLQRGLAVKSMADTRSRHHSLLTKGLRSGRRGWALALGSRLTPPTFAGRGLRARFGREGLSMTSWSART
jgi:hypothetical protein